MLPVTFWDEVQSRLTRLHMIQLSQAWFPMQKRRHTHTHNQKKGKTKTKQKWCPEIVQFLSTVKWCFFNIFIYFYQKQKNSFNKNLKQIWRMFSSFTDIKTLIKRIDQYNISHKYIHNPPTPKPYKGNVVPLSLANNTSSKKGRIFAARFALLTL